MTLDSYDDIFSDFDPRTFDVREISHDFLDECKRRIRETYSGAFFLTMVLPQDKRFE
jgi:hypothetical protein